MYERTSYVVRDKVVHHRTDFKEFDICQLK